MKGGTYMTLGERMKEARLYCGMTQPEVAGKLGVTFQTISSWEKNRTSPTPQDLLQLSEIYNTSMYDLLGKPTQDTPFGRAVLSAMDRDILDDYHNLPPDAKAIVDLIFAQHRNSKEKEREA
jgi:transcriptional regulator with XRE-family HTH domain